MTTWGEVWDFVCHVVENYELDAEIRRMNAEKAKDLARLATHSTGASAARWQLSQRKRQIAIEQSEYLNSLDFSAMRWGEICQCDARLQQFMVEWRTLGSGSNRQEDERSWTHFRETRDGFFDFKRRFVESVRERRVELLERAGQLVRLTAEGDWDDQLWAQAKLVALKLREHWRAIPRIEHDRKSGYRGRPEQLEFDRLMNAFFASLRAHRARAASDQARARHGRGQQRSAQEGASNFLASNAPITLPSAQAIFSLQSGFTRVQIMSAYRRLMRVYHPDRGGSTYKAQRINIARDMLIQSLG